MLREVRSVVADVANRLTSTNEKITASLKDQSQSEAPTTRWEDELDTRCLLVVQAFCDARKSLRAGVGLHVGR